jgi:hypothetical protein
MKQLIYFMCFGMFFLLVACEPNSDVKPSEEPVSIDLENMDLSNLSIDMDLTSSFDFGLSDRESLDQLTDQLIKEFFQDGEENLGWFEMAVSTNKTYIIAGGEDASGGNKARGCSGDEWTTVGKGLCRSEDCVRDRLVTAFEDAGAPGVGECVDTRVHRSLTGATVCWKKGACY